MLRCKYVVGELMFSDTLIALFQGRLEVKKEERNKPLQRRGKYQRNTEPPEAREIHVLLIYYCEYAGLNKMDRLIGK